MRPWNTVLTGEIEIWTKMYTFIPYFFHYTNGEIGSQRRIKSWFDFVFYGFQFLICIYSEILFS